MNTGVREDELDAYLTAHNLMMQTVTAGGFFSLGGMTAVDVHGGTMNAPIFAETVSAFTIVRADGPEITIDARSSRVGNWSPLQFARVSLGGLGVVTSVTIDVIDRPCATTLHRWRRSDCRLADRSRPSWRDSWTLEGPLSAGVILHPLRHWLRPRGFPSMPRTSSRCGGM